MYNILTLNSISEKGLVKLPAKDFIVADKMETPDGILVRSGDMHNYEMPDTLLGIARAGAGTNNIPVDKCAEKGIVVFNTPGANANAVKELVLTGILISSRRIVEGIEWSKSLKGKEHIDKLVESGKKQFAGPEIKGKKLGIIGLGAIGVMVANAAVSLGMDVMGYDPFLSVYSAWSISSDVELADSIVSIAEQCDYVSIHVPLNDNTKNMFNAEIFSMMKKGSRLLNFSRGGLVETSALKNALENGTLDKYITDFPGEEVLNLDNVLAIPHLGASTPESEENCAEMAAIELKAYIKYGTIKNSVNFPNCESLYTGKARVTIAHKNIPNMVGSITAVFAKHDLNIDNMLNKSKGNWAYTIIDLDSLYGKNDNLIAELKLLPGVVRARIVREK
ncbi:MAG TPA: 3-phosphoglycerate dehydrogenase [Lachnospiraceae bacterium]|nr:3-phosphoglycerate dehydrogenase [Lachnospiraceae bacterium]